MLSLKSRRYLCALATLVSLCLLLPTTPAAAQVVTGSIEGTVVDGFGGVLPGAAVTVTNPATGVVRTVVSDGDRRAVGVWHVQAAARATHAGTNREPQG